MTQIKDSLRAAVEVLVAEGPIKIRLSRAFDAHLEPLAELDLPPAIADLYHDLAAAMHRVDPVGRQTCVHATVQKMSSVEAASHAMTILTLYSSVLHQSERAGPLKVVERAVGAAPRYLVKNP